MHCYSYCWSIVWCKVIVSCIYYAKFCSQTQLETQLYDGRSGWNLAKACRNPLLIMYGYVRALYVLCSYLQRSACLRDALFSFLVAPRLSAQTSSAHNSVHRWSDFPYNAHPKHSLVIKCGWYQSLHANNIEPTNRVQVLKSAHLLKKRLLPKYNSYCFFIATVGLGGRANIDYRPLFYGHLHVYIEKFTKMIRSSIYAQRLVLDSFEDAR